MVCERPIQGTAASDETISLGPTWIGRTLVYRDCVKTSFREWQVNVNLKSNPARWGFEHSWIWTHAGFLVKLEKKGSRKVE